MPSSLTEPLTDEFSMERKSGFQRNWATPRKRIMMPKVVKICDSMGALTMRTITRNRKVRAWLALVVASGGLAILTSTPASAAPVTIDLCAKAGSITLPGPTSVPIWGFALKPADLAITGDTDGTTTTVTNLSSTAGLLAGMGVSGVGIAPGGTATTNGRTRSAEPSWLAAAMASRVSRKAMEMACTY